MAADSIRGLIILAPHCRERKAIQKEDRDEANYTPIKINIVIHGQITTDTSVI